MHRQPSPGIAHPPAMCEASLASCLSFVQTLQSSWPHIHCRCQCAVHRTRNVAECFSRRHCGGRQQRALLISFTFLRDRASCGAKQSGDPFRCLYHAQGDPLISFVGKRPLYIIVDARSRATPYCSRGQATLAHARGRPPHFGWSSHACRPHARRAPKSNIFDQNRPSGRPKAGHRLEFEIISMRIRPKSGPGARPPAR